jgi:hypothetical protein
MTIPSIIIAIMVEIAVSISSDINVLESFFLFLWAAAISRTPTVVIPIIEIRTK